MRVGDIGHDGTDGAAGNGFFERPEELDDRVGADENERAGLEPEGAKAQPIGQAQLLGVGFELKDQQARPLGGKHGSRLGESETERGTGVDQRFGENLMHIAPGGREEARGRRSGIGFAQHRTRFERRDFLFQGLERVGLTAGHCLAPSPEQIVNMRLGSGVKRSLLWPKGFKAP